MLNHALVAIEKESRHPLAIPYAALAAMKLGDKKRALDFINRALTLDPLNHLARFVRVLVTGKGMGAFYAAMNASPSQTCLDAAYDLLNAGFAEEAIQLLSRLAGTSGKEAMVRYTLAYAYEMVNDEKAANKYRQLASQNKIVEVFPARTGEMLVLEAAIRANENDAFAKYLLGCQYYHMRKYEEAAKLFEDSIRLDETFYIPYRNLALVYYNHLGRPADAKNLLIKAIELNPNDALLLSETASVMVRLHDNKVQSLQNIL